ncbi:plasmid mobilization relaxosome protein MobC [Acinetobacter radioresistens]|uniref:plasmid mobilization relaxosome protein MobC n=1 Tax=Acinetobacter radioresistens TaxID=40216 RepID=UPI0035585976
MKKIGIIEDPIYLKVEREKLYQLSKIGTNINQIAYAVNQEMAGTGTYKKVKLLQLLISIDNQIRSISL